MRFREMTNEQLSTKVRSLLSFDYFAKIYHGLDLDADIEFAVISSRFKIELFCYLTCVYVNIIETKLDHRKDGKYPYFDVALDAFEAITWQINRIITRQSEFMNGRGGMFTDDICLFIKTILYGSIEIGNIERMSSIPTAMKRG